MVINYLSDTCFLQKRWTFFSADFDFSICRQRRIFHFRIVGNNNNFHCKTIALVNVRQKLQQIRLPNNLIDSILLVYGNKLLLIINVYVCVFARSRGDGTSIINIIKQIYRTFCVQLFPNREQNIVGFFLLLSLNWLICIHKIPNEAVHFFFSRSPLLCVYTAMKLWLFIELLAAYFARSPSLFSFFALCTLLPLICGVCVCVRAGVFLLRVCA